MLESKSEGIVEEVVDRSVVHLIRTEVEFEKVKKHDPGFINLVS
jgi:hypothetical protein